MEYNRILNFVDLETSAFLFGPRLTGKTTFLHTLNYNYYFDLLDPDLILDFLAKPKTFFEQLKAMPKNSLIVVDEIQKAPVLLDYVQMAIEQLKLNFILSGSSARKLKRGGANLLGGRAIDLKLHPLTYIELKKKFNINFALNFGTLPKIYSLLENNKEDLVKKHLKSYVSTYLNQEIQAEAITRNLGAFNRFLNVAAGSNAQIIEYSNISNECSVPSSTVKEYYQILEDTLIGFFLNQYDRSERKKSRSKFYFFDCGVVRSIQNRLNDPPTSGELGHLFETWFVNELIRIRDYYNKEHQFSFWRKEENEIDIIISGGHGPILAIECKSGRNDKIKTKVFRKYFEIPIIVASLSDSRPRRIEKDNILVLPYNQALDYYKNNF